MWQGAIKYSMFGLESQCLLIIMFKPSDSAALLNFRKKESFPCYIYNSLSWS